MPVPGWLTTDPDPRPKLPPRLRPGWAPRPGPKVKLQRGWEVPEKVGSGQDEPEDNPFYRMLVPSSARDVGYPIAPASAAGPNVEDPSARPEIPTTPGSVSEGTTPPGLTEAPSSATTIAEPRQSTEAPQAAQGGDRGVLPSPTQAATSQTRARAGEVSGAPKGAPPPQGPTPAPRSAPPADPQAPTGEVEAYIRQAAQARGIDPNIALKVADTEGGRVPNRRGTFKTGSSWGPFQLHYGGAGYENLGTVAGMGNSFTARTGFQPGDPAGWKAGVDYALDHAKSNGWGAWYGAKAVGITGYTGIDQTKPWTPGTYSGPAATAASPTAPTTQAEVSKNATRRVVSGRTDSPLQSVTSAKGGGVGEPKRLAPDKSGRQGVQSVIDVGSTAIGTKYQWGGAGGRSSFEDTLSPTDCSGFVAWAYQKATGKKLTAQTSHIWEETQSVHQDDAAPGDLVMYNMGSGAGLQHVGIYVGNGQMLHDSSMNPNGGVDITPLWKGASFRRVGGLDPEQANYSISESTMRRPNPNPDEDPEQESYAMVHAGRIKRFKAARSGYTTVVDEGEAPAGSKNGQIIEHSPGMAAPGWMPFAPTEGFAPQLGAGQETPEGFDLSLPIWGTGESSSQVQAMMDRAQQERDEKARRDAEFQERLRVGAEREAREKEEGGFFGGLGRGIGGAFSGLGTAVSGAVEAAPEAVGGAFSGLGTAVQEAKTGFEEELAKPPEPYRAPVETATPVTMEDGQSGAAQVKESVTEAVQHVPEMAQAVADAATTVSDTLTALPQNALETGLTVGAVGLAVGGSVAETLSSPDAQRAAETVHHIGRAITPATTIQEMYPGIQGSVDWLRDNGYDWEKVQAKMDEPLAKPGTAAEIVANGGTITNPVDMVRLVAEGWDKVNEVKDEAIKQAQPPEIRDSPEGWVFRQGASLAMDPTTYIGTPGVTSVGKKLLVEGGETILTKSARGQELIRLAQEGIKQAPAVERAMLAGEAAAAKAAAEAGKKGISAAAGLGPAAAQVLPDVAAQMTPDLARAFTAEEQAHVLQRAALDLNNLELEQASKALGTGRFEPLSGEQIRREILNKVAMSDPSLKPGQILAKVDEIVQGAGFEGLTTDAMIKSGRIVADDVVEATLPWYQEAAQMARRLEQAAVHHATAAQPATASVPLALNLGAGGLGAAYAAAMTEDDDPNRMAKILGAGAVAFGASIGVPWASGLIDKSVTPKVMDALKKTFAPAARLAPEMRVPFENWANKNAMASQMGELLEMQWKELTGEFGQDISLARYIEMNDKLPPFLASKPGAADAYDNWKNVVAWARKLNIVPEPLQFKGAGSAKQYVPHVVEQEWNEILTRFSKETGRGNYASKNPFLHYTKHREYATLDDGIAAGVTYAGDLPSLMGNYYTRAIQKLALNNLTDEIKALANINDQSKVTGVLGDILMEHADVARFPKDAGWGRTPKNAIPISNYAPFKNIDELKDVYISSKLDDVFKIAMTDEGAGNPFVNMVAEGNALFKHNVLSGIDFYHMLSEIGQTYATQGWNAPKTLGQMFVKHTMPGQHKQWLLDPKNRALMEDAMAHGMNMTVAPDLAEHLDIKQRFFLAGTNMIIGGVSGYQAALSSGASNEDALKIAAGTALFGGGVSLPAGPVMQGMGKVLRNPALEEMGEKALWQRSMVEHITHTMFDQWIPFLKMSTYEMYKPAFPGQEKAVAEFVNEVYGGQNIAAIARSRGVQDAMRMAILAPDWQEGWARLIGNSVFNHSKDMPTGQMARKYWGTALVQSAVWLEGLNLALGGQWSWENDTNNQLMVNVSNLYKAAGWSTKDAEGREFTPYWDALGPFKGMAEPMVETSRWAMAGTYDKLGFGPQGGEAGRLVGGAVGGEFGEVPKPDPAAAWAKFLGSRGGWLMTGANELLSEVDFAGKPIDRARDPEYQSVVNRVMMAMQNMQPSGQTEIARSIARGDPWQVAAATVLTGRRTRRVTKGTEYFTWQKEWLNEVGADEKRWMGMRDEATKKNRVIDADIDAVQAGNVSIGANGEAVKAEVGKSNMTAAQRSDRIEALASQRVSQRQQYADLLGQMPEGPEKEVARQHLSDLQQMDMDAGAPVAVDLADPLLDMDEIYRLAWERDPHEIARLKGMPRDLNAFSDIAEKIRSALDRQPGYDEEKKLTDLRQRWMADTADTYGIDQAVLQDYVKAHIYQMTTPDGKFAPPPLPGVNSEQLDELADQYQAAGRGPKGEAAIDPATAGMMRQEWAIKTAADLGVDPKALTQRVQLRTMPVTDSTEAAVSRRHALDVLNQSRYYKYQNEDGTPMGLPTEWPDMDKKLELERNRFTFREHGGEGFYSKNGELDVELTEMYRAKQRATANRYKDVIRSEHADDYYRWFGDGAQLTDEQWSRYKNGTLDMWRDNPSPREGQNRVQATRIWAALTPAEKNKYGVPELGGGQPIAWEQYNPWTGKVDRNRGSLSSYMRYLRLYKYNEYKLGDMDLDQDPAQAVASEAAA